MADFVHTRRSWQAAECGTKVRYRSYKRASRIAGELAARYREDVPLRVYHCRWCGFFHYGHEPLRNAND